MSAEPLNDKAASIYDGLAEVVWAGQPRGEDATCVVCSGFWPHHVPECFLGELHGRVKALEDAAGMIRDFDPAGGNEWWEAHARLYAALEGTGARV